MEYVLGMVESLVKSVIEIGNSNLKKMLVSHRYKFIYLKSRKTAGTSTEAFLERYCAPPEGEKNHAHQHSHKHAVSKYGIIGNRQRGHSKYSAHSSPNRVKELVGNNCWEQYTKVVNVRNPYDVAVSMYHWRTYEKNHPISFKKWVNTPAEHGRLKNNLNFWELSFNNTFYIKYESLKEDINRLMGVLNLPSYSDTLPTYKANLYKRKHYTEYYDSEVKQVIDKDFGHIVENLITLFNASRRYYKFLLV